MTEPAPPGMPRQFALVAYGAEYAEAAAALESLVAPISPLTMGTQLGLRAAVAVTEIALAERQLVGLLDVRSTDGERFVVRLVVAPDARRQGLGSYLFQRAAEVAASSSPEATLRARIRDDDLSSLEWATRRGFEEFGHRISMSKSLQEEPEVFESRAAEAMTRAGVTIDRWPATPGKDDWSWLTDLFATCLIDSLDSAGVRPTEETTRYIAPYPDGVLIALRDGQPMGITSIAPEGQRLWNSWFTGVVPSARGSGVATALKWAALAVAREEGADRVHTYNDVVNDPIIRLNEALGYERQPGVRLLRGGVDRPSA